MTGNSVNRPLIRYVALAAAAVGTIQALIWVWLSLIPILFYHSVISYEETLSYYRYEYFMYNIFLNPDVITTERIIVTTKVFSIFMYVYLTLSVIWFVASLFMLWAMERQKWKDSVITIGGWSGVTILISVLDIVVMSLLAADCVTMQDVMDQTLGSFTHQLLNTTQSTTDSIISVTSTLETIATTTIISPSADNAPPSFVEYLLAFNNFNVYADGLSDIAILLKQTMNISYLFGITLAARGYILWIVNITFAIILMKFAIALSRDAKKSLLPLIDSYSTGRPPWNNNLYEQTDIGNGYSNQAYVEDNDREVFPRSDSFISPEPETKNQNPLSSGANPYAQQMDKLRPIADNPNIVSPKLAKIGKQNGRRTPPRNVPPPNIPLSNSPYIPDPDYSPPGSPLKPKSALRPKSNYVL